MFGESIPLQDPYLVAIFAVEPAHETAQLTGSLGRVGRDGGLDWHVEIVQVRRHPRYHSRGAALAVVYLRIEQHDWMNVVEGSDIQRATDLLETLIAPKQWSSGFPLVINFLSGTNYGVDGRPLGGTGFVPIIYQAAQGSLARGVFDWALLDQHEEVRWAIRYYTRGIAAAHERFLPDACMNYARALECIVGSTQAKPQLTAECARLGLNAAAILSFLEETRNKYAIAHTLNRASAKQRKLKAQPSAEIERDARDLVRDAIASYIEHLPELDHRAELNKGLRYTGLPPVATNLPLPSEVLWSRSRHWGSALPSVEPDLVSVYEATKRYGMSRPRLKRLMQEHILEGYKRWRGWPVEVSSTMIEAYETLAEEDAMGRRDGIFVTLERASAMTGLTVAELRQLVRERLVRGKLRDRIMGAVVEEDSLRYFLWRKRRESIVQNLDLPNPLKPHQGSRPAQRSSRT